MNTATIIHYAGAGSVAACAAIAVISGVNQGSVPLAVIGGVAVVYLVGVWRKAGKTMSQANGY